MVALLVALLVAGCASGPDVDPLPEPKRPKGVQPTPTTVFEELGAVGLPRARGATTTSVPLGPGTTTITGIVDGPDGPVPDAIVVLERLVGDGVVRTVVPTGPDGNWNLANVLGGRWRIRAFKPPSLAQAGTTVQFLSGRTPPKVVLRVDRHEGVVIDRALAPNPPVVGSATSLTIQVGLTAVDENGAVQTKPQVGEFVQLVGAQSSWSSDAATGVTDGSGRVTFRLVCRQPGKQALSAAVAGVVRELDLPACVSPTPSTTTTTVVGGATSSSSTSSTSTTTTTRPR